MLVREMWVREMWVREMWVRKTFERLQGDAYYTEGGWDQV
jgi:hypothetical protein